MQSSAGSRNPHLRAAIFAAGVPFFALAVSLFLAYAVATAPRAYLQFGPAEVPVARTVPARMQPLRVADRRAPRTLWDVLQPFALGADALAIAGLALACWAARRTEGART